MILLFVPFIRLCVSHSSGFSAISCACTSLSYICTYIHIFMLTMMIETFLISFVLHVFYFILFNHHYAPLYLDQDDLRG